MSNLKSVVVGTDGCVDYVEVPDGTRYVLGATSVLTVITKLVSGQNERRMALDLFNKEGQAVVLLDLESLFDMLAPKRARWSSATSLIPRTDRTDSLQKVPSGGTGTNMDKASYESKLAQIEQNIALLNRGPNPRALQNLQAAVASINLKDLGDQSTNAPNSGPPKVDTVEDPGAYTPPPNVTHPLGKTASFATLQSNLKLAEQILSEVGATDDKIDALVTAGRRFNASKARADLHGIVATVTDMLGQVDLAEPWVADDLQKLAAQSSEIYNLFAPAKV